MAGTICEIEKVTHATLRYPQYHLCPVRALMVSMCIHEHHRDTHIASRKYGSVRGAAEPCLKTISEIEVGRWHFAPVIVLK